MLKRKIFCFLGSLTVFGWVKHVACLAATSYLGSCIPLSYTTVNVAKTKYLGIPSESIVFAFFSTVIHVYNVLPTHTLIHVYNCSYLLIVCTLSLTPHTHTLMHLHMWIMHTLCRTYEFPLSQTLQSFNHRCLLGDTIMLDLPELHGV